MSRQRARKSERKPEVKKEAIKSPRNYLKITEWRLWVIGLSIILVLVFAALGIQYAHARASYKKYQVERQKAMEEIHFWKNITTQYSDYRDAYFRIAVLYYQVGDTTKAKEYLASALELDPNFEKGRELEAILFDRTQ